MSFWNRNPDRDLERRLREGRPQAREDFVSRLAGETPAPARVPRRRRSALPRAVVVLALTAALTGALGVAGAIGYASKSVKTFGNNVEHVFSSNNGGKDGKDDNCKGTNQSGSFGGQTNHYNGTNDRYGGNDDGDDKDCKGNEFHDPFHHVYGIKLPICDPNGNLTTVPLGEYLFFIFFEHYYPASTNDNGKTFFCDPPPKTKH